MIKKSRSEEVKRSDQSGPFGFILPSTPAVSVSAYAAVSVFGFVCFVLLQAQGTRLPQVV